MVQSQGGGHNGTVAGRQSQWCCCSAAVAVGNLSGAVPVVLLQWDLINSPAKLIQMIGLFSSREITFASLIFASFIIVF